MSDLLLSRIDLPMRTFSVLLVPTDGLRLPTPALVEAESDGVFPVIEVAMREVRPVKLPASGTPTELAAGCLATVEADGLSIRIELLTPGCEPGAGLSIRIERPIREVLPESIRKLELVIDPLDDEETDGLLVVIEPPIRDVLSGLIRMLELLLTEVEPVELLPIEMPDEGTRELDETEGLEIVICLDVDPLGLLLEDIVPEPSGVDRLTDILLEPLRLGADRLTDILLELLPPGAGLLDVIVLDRLGVGAILVVVLLELLGLEIDRLGLRLADIELDRLGVGARVGAGALLTDDVLGLLRVGAGALVGAGARLGGAGLAACVVWLVLLLELELFRELLAARTESAAKTKREMQIINLKPQILARRSGKTCNPELSLYVSMTASFLRKQFCKRASAPRITGSNLPLGNQDCALFKAFSHFFRIFGIVPKAVGKQYLVRMRLSH